MSGLRPLLCIPIAWLVAFGFFTNKAIAQGQLRDTGSRPWVIVKGSLNDFTGKSDTIVGDCNSEREAKEQAQRLNEALKGDDAYKWLFTYRKRKQDDPSPADDPTTGSGKKVEIPKPKFVDPAARKKGAKASLLAGKKGIGRLGNDNVTIEFSKSGEFVITGEVQGKGKWSETDNGGVYMETERSTFRGNIKGDKVGGLWFTKNNSQPVTEWSVTLQKAQIVFLGTKWLHDVGNFKLLEFGPNGDVIWHRPDGSTFTHHTWRQEGDYAIITSSEGNVIIRLTINGDTLEGRYPDQAAIIKYGTRVK